MKKLITILLFLSAINSNAQKLLINGYKHSNIAYATWNPSDKDAAITLSSGNLAVASSSTFVAVRANVGKSSGDWYWEIKVTNGGGAIMGVSNLTPSVSSSFAFGADANSSGLITSNGSNTTVTAQNGSFSGALYTAFATNDIVSFAYSAGGNSLLIKINGSTIATLTGINSGTMYPYVGTWDTAGATFLANFGASAFAFTPPSGYTGLY